VILFIAEAFIVEALLMQGMKLGRWLTSVLFLIVATVNNAVGKSQFHFFVFYGLLADLLNLLILHKF